MKKIVRILVVAALLLLGICLVSCGASASVDAVYFAKDNMPRQTYVQGQELDFSGALLTCETGGKTETVPMDSPEVSVSGYSKDTLGEQTVTVTYRDRTANLRVTVIPRMTVEGYDTDYFVGDGFNKLNGRVKVADDNAVISTVNMKDSAVTVTGFDSSTPGTKEITVSCNGYTGTFRVNVLAVEKVTLKNPGKKAYQSHETEFSVEGGYLTVTSTGGVMQKTVPLSADMVRGYDPAVAGQDNKTSATAVRQTVYIEYLGYSFPFEITVRYSGVSNVRDRAAEMADVDLTAPIDEIPGISAMDAMNDYFYLSKADQDLIPQEEKDTVARVAAIYAYDRFVQATAVYSHTFTLVPGESTDGNGTRIEYCGYFTIDCDSYDNMMITLTALSDGTADFVTLGAFLHSLEAEFPLLEVEPGVTPDQYFETLFLTDDLPYVLDLFRQMVGIYEKLSVVPEEWDKETIKAPQMVQGIESAYSRILSCELSYNDYPEFYDMISSWRARDDAYEILHTHYLYNKTYTGDDENYVAQVWEKIPFPHDLQTLYDYIAVGYVNSRYMQSNVYDTTYFMVVFRACTQLSEQIKTGDNALYRDIYTAIDFDSLIDGYLYHASKTDYYSYFDVIGTLYYNREVLDLLWNDYFAIADLADEEGWIDTEDPAAAQAIEKMFGDFFSVDAYERFEFLCSLYSNYRDLKIEGFAFDYSDGFTGDFIGLLAEYYTGEKGVLPESTHALFQKLMIATEQYGIRYKYLTVAATAVSEYVEMMEEIVTLYGSLSAADRAVFDTCAGAAYAANMQAYSAMKATAPDIGTFPLLQELKTVMESYYTLLDAIAKDGEAANSAGTYALLFAAYEKAKDICGAVLASDDADMINAYLFYNYMVLNENDGNPANDYALTLEAVYDEIKVSANGYVIRVTDDGENTVSYRATDYYTEGGLVGFFVDCYKVLYTNFIGGVNTKEDILTLMEKYRALEAESVEVFCSLHMDSCYYATLDAFFASALEGDSATMALATALMAAEKAYAGYLQDAENEEALRSFRTAWEAAAEAFSGLGDATENFRSLLEAMYAYYQAKYNALTPAG